MIMEGSRAGLGAAAGLLRSRVRCGENGLSGRGGGCCAGRVVGGRGRASGCEGEGGCLFALVHRFARREVEAWGE
jgi:hypothetical protein